MINANSVKDRLKTVAKESGHLFQDELVAYCLERTIYRISVSQYNENFTLKGGIFLYAIFERDFPRATRDIDLLGRDIDGTVEKIKAVFEAIVSLGYANSRYKDFYDIYLLSRKFDFDGEDLSNAIKETFEHRKTLLNDIVAFDQEFWEEEARAARWKAFLKKKRAMIKLEFGEVVAEIRSFLNPVVEALQNEKLYKRLWKAENQLWK